MSAEGLSGSVLLTSVGSRVDLVDGFRSAVGDLGRVLACDRDAGAAALAFSDLAIESPPFRSPRYLDWIIEICAREAIDLVVPLHEQDGERLCHAVEPLQQRGTLVAVGTSATYQLVADKLRLSQAASGWGLRSPATVSLHNLVRLDVLGDVPLMVKPRYGRGSRGVRRYARFADLSAEPQSPDAEPMVVQPLLEGHEFGLDVVNDLGGRYRTSFHRRKIRMSDGETAEAETCWSADLEQVAQTLGTVIGHRGCLDADLMFSEGRWYLLDLNLRFGGGYPFSHAAGADLPAALVAWALGREPPQGWDRPRLGVRSIRTKQVRPVPGGQGMAVDDEFAPGVRPC